MNDAVWYVVVAQGYVLSDRKVCVGVMIARIALCQTNNLMVFILCSCFTCPDADTCLTQSLKVGWSRCTDAVFSICFLSICGWKCYNTRPIHWENGVRPYSNNQFHTLLIAFMACQLLVTAEVYFINARLRENCIYFYFQFSIFFLDTVLLQHSGFCFVVSRSTVCWK